MAPSSLFLLDPLCCQEDHWDVVEEQHQKLSLHQVQELEVEDQDWEHIMQSLMSKQEEMKAEADDSYVAGARGEAVAWVARAAEWHGFGAVTVILAVHYLDRYFLTDGLLLQRDKPWMGRLAALACLSLAGKVEETRVPLLLDLQAVPDGDAEEQAGFLFEAKTIRRMELLVLSALGWRMNPVTPLSFIHHLLPKLSSNVREVLRRCHAILLAVIADWRWICYPPSVWAVAALLHAIGHGVASQDFEETHNRLFNLLNVPKERVEECYQHILETMAAGNGDGAGSKRKHVFSFSFPYYSASPSSPNGVIESCFSYESSSSSGSEPWASVWPSSVSSSPEHPPHKKPKTITTNEDGDNGDQHHLLNLGVFT